MHKASIFITHAHVQWDCVEWWSVRINSRGVSWPEENPLISGDKDKESREIMCAFSVIGVITRRTRLLWSLWFTALTLQHTGKVHIQNYDLLRIMFGVSCWEKLQSVNKNSLMPQESKKSAVTSVTGTLPKQAVPTSSLDHRSPKCIPKVGDWVRGKKKRETAGRGCEKRSKMRGNEMRD